MIDLARCEKILQQLASRPAPLTTDDIPRLQLIQACAQVPVSPLNVLPREGTMSDIACPDCGQELDHLDHITRKTTRESYDLWICRNEDCPSYDGIWNDQKGSLWPGDPVGIY